MFCLIRWDWYGVRWGDKWLIIVFVVDCIVNGEDKLNFLWLGVIGGMRDLKGYFVVLVWKDVFIVMLDYKVCLVYKNVF